MDLKQSISNLNDVSTSLTIHLLSKKFPKSNIVFSPFSINVALNMVASGAKGETRDQLVTFLKANTTDDLNSLYSQLLPLILSDGGRDDEPCLSVANGVWVEKTLPIKPSFKQVLDTHYKAACKQVDFKNKAVEVPNEVNLWVEKNTNGLIEKILPPNSVSSATSLILANALYFKGIWHDPFSDACTEDSDFHLLNGNKIQVPFMYKSESHQLVHEYDDFKVLGLQYVRGPENHRFTMYFFLPNANDGLQSLVDKIGSESNFLDSHIPRKDLKVRQLCVPKFEMSFGFEASDMLMELGLELPFDEDCDEFTEMVDLPIGKTLSVSRVYHKSFIDVNETGTEAGAVTEVEFLMGYGLDVDRDVHFVDFVADHPFLFVIREDVTGVLLFMGQVIDPRSRNF